MRACGLGVFHANIACRLTIQKHAGLWASSRNSESSTGESKSYLNSEHVSDWASHDTAHVHAGAAAVPDLSLLESHLQQEWDHTANAQLGGITIRPHSNRRVWWSAGLCKSGEPHRWQATVQSRTRGARCPYQSGNRVCPCNSVAHTHPELAAEWDLEANGARTPETVSAGSNKRVAWRCRKCSHRWTTMLSNRTCNNRGCRECAKAARVHNRQRQPTVKEGAKHLLEEWDYEANEREGWHPGRVTCGSNKLIHWVRGTECRLGLEHRWQASPFRRALFQHGSPYDSGQAVCACNSLAENCPQAALLWDYNANKGLTPDTVAVQSHEVVSWVRSDGKKWQQRVYQVVRNLQKSEA